MSGYNEQCGHVECKGLSACIANRTITLPVRAAAPSVEPRLPDIDTAEFRWTFSDAVTAPDPVAGLREALAQADALAARDHDELDCPGAAAYDLLRAALHSKDGAS